MPKQETASSDSLPAADREAIGKLSFEQAMKELESIVRKLESGNAELESALIDYTHANALKEHCMQKLAAAKLKVEALVRREDGTLTTDQFDPS